MDPRTRDWDDIALRWDALLADETSYVNAEASFRRFHWFLKRSLKIGNRTKSYRLLDLGCGTGEASWPLWKRVASVTFLDRSPAMLRLARNKWPKGIFVRGQAGDLPFLEAEFDVILSRGALLSQLDPLEVGPALERLYKSMRPQAVLLFDFVANPEAWPAPAHAYPNAWTREAMTALLARHLPGATILGWDGTARHALNRVLLRK